MLIADNFYIDFYIESFSTYSMAMPLQCDYVTQDCYVLSSCSRATIMSFKAWISGDADELGLLRHIVLNPDQSLRMMKCKLPISVSMS